MLQLQRGGSTLKNYYPKREQMLPGLAYEELLPSLESLYDFEILK